MTDDKDDDITPQEVADILFGEELDDLKPKLQEAELNAAIMIRNHAISNGLSEVAESTLGAIIRSAREKGWWKDKYGKKSAN
jgi:hypothetical protein